MSLHITCEKCGKYLGGVAPVEGHEKEVFESFFKGVAESVCDDLPSCPYKDGA